MVRPSADDPDARDPPVGRGGRFCARMADFGYTVRLNAGGSLAPLVAGSTRVQVPLHKGAEAFSFWTHGIGVLFAIAGLIYLVVSAEGARAVTSFAVYGTTLIVLLSASTLHHAVQTAHGHERSGFLRRLDHVSIYLFIAGTYTPVTLLALPPVWGWTIFGVVWGIAAIGIVMKLFAPFAPRWVTSGVYVLMGWVAVVGIKPLLDNFSIAALLWLLAGGIVYTVGAVGYATKKPDLWPELVGFHGVWHVMVLIGVSLHFVFMVGYVL